MKKRKVRSIVLAAIMVLTLAVTACGQKTLESMFNDADTKAQFESAFSGLEGSGLELSYEVKGNDFTMTLQITDSSLVTDGIAEQLQAALDAQGDTFKEQVAQFDEAVGKEGACTATVRYTDPDGKVLAEGTFTAE